MNGALGNHIRRSIEKMHLVPFDTIFDNGYRHITSSVKPIQSPDDLKGFKIRVPLVPLWVSMFKTPGAAPVSLPLSESVPGAANQGCRQPGKSADADRLGQVLRDSEILLAVQPLLGRLLVCRQRTDLERGS